MIDAIAAKQPDTHVTGGWSARSVTWSREFHLDRDQSSNLRDMSADMLAYTDTIVTLVSRVIDGVVMSNIICMVDLNYC